jgi:hypothetical protein
MLALASIMTGLLAAWLVLMVGFPRLWAAVLDKEYEFLVRLGLLSEGLADRIRRIDKGRGIPVAVGALLALYLFVTIILVASRLS